MSNYPDSSTIQRLRKALEVRGREPKDWPVPVKREDLQNLLDAYSELTTAPIAYFHTAGTVNCILKE